MPIAIAQRGDLAKAMLTTKQVWSQFITGRRTEEVHKNWAQTFRRACLHHPGGRSSRSLEKVLRWGHLSDLDLTGCQRFLSTLHSWWVRVGSCRFAQVDLPQLPGLSVVSDTLGKWGWVCNGWGVWGHPQGWTLNVKDCPSNFMRGLHHLREAWRRREFELWLGSSRRDAQFAVAAQIRFSNQLYKKLVKLPSSLGGDAVAVAVGGMSTPATASRVPQECPYCMSAMVPSVDHIIWFCSWEPFVKARVS